MELVYAIDISCVYFSQQGWKIENVWFFGVYDYIRSFRCQTFLCYIWLVFFMVQFLVFEIRFF